MLSRSLNDVSFDTFDKFQKGILDYANTNAVTMGIDPHIVNDLHVLSATWQDAYQKCKNDGLINKIFREERVQARIGLTKKLRPFIINLYYNENVTPVDLAGMNLPLGLRTSSKNKTLNVSEIPAFKVQAMEGAIMKYFCRNASGSFSKPEGAVSLQIKYYFGTNPPASPTEYPYEVLSGKCRGTIELDENMKMQPLHIAARWVGKDQQASHFSNSIFTSVLP